MKKSVKKSVFETLNFQEVTNSSSADNYRFEVVEGSNTIFSKSDLAKITKCILRTTKNLKERDELTLLIEVKAGKKQLRLWVKLDGISYKRYKDNANCSIDPSKVCIYKLHDPEEEYGKPENDYSWQVCRIKKDALVNAPDNGDDALFNVPF